MNLNSGLWNRWSPSKLKTYDDCPRKFEFNYVLGIKPPLPSAMVFGSAVHYMAEQFFKKNYKSKKSFLNAWSYYWKYRILNKEKNYDFETKKAVDPSKEIGVIFRKPEEDEIYLYAGTGTLSQFYELNMPYKENELLRPEVEHRFKEEIDFPVNNSTLKSRFTINGVIDRIQPLEDGGYEIWDYKTGLGKYLEPHMKREFQFTFYHFYMLLKTGKDPSNMYICKLKTQNQGGIENSPVPLRAEQDFMEMGEKLNKIKREVLTIIDPPDRYCKDAAFLLNKNGYFKEDHFEKRPDRQCSFCNYDKICREFNPVKQKKHDVKLKDIISS